MSTPFRNVLREGTKGTQSAAVKRGLWRAGYRHGWDALDGDEVMAEVLGPLGVLNLTAFEADHGRPLNGIYEAGDHALLEPSFDDYARLLYLKTPPIVGPKLQLPMQFTPDHPTDGLPGFPAKDFFAKAGTTVLSPQAGKVTKLSGHDPREGGDAGGAYGWSIYITCPSCVYFLTHFGTRTVSLGEQVKRGDVIGTVCDAAVAHMASSSSHIHEGKHSL